ncbi:MAG: Rrf2 family transcriptional regulator [Bdellovibrio sp.]|nr:Rrf2 family transcriptional regulator [Bdellovibrio sp.]
MLRINKKVEYALMALKFMSDEKTQGELASAREVCDKFHTPFDTTAKVMQAMNNSGILQSVKGIKGGYILARDLNTLTYMELARILEKKMGESLCRGSEGNCELLKDCNIAAPIERLNITLNQYLDQLSIKQLFDMAFNATPYQKQTSFHV